MEFTSVGTGNGYNLYAWGRKARKICMGVKGEEAMKLSST
jgi:hypothetical protein